MLWFWLQLLFSLPPIVNAQLKGTASMPLPSNGTLSNQFSALAEQEPKWAEYVGDECKKGDECAGNIRWEIRTSDGCQSGYCQECGTSHVKCGNCGQISFAEGYIQCASCGHRASHRFRFYV
jgi:hypothetical protein